MNYENTTKKIHSDWKPFFEDTKDQLTDIFTKVNQSMQKYQEKGIEIFPKKKKVFKAFNYFGPKQTRVVILGQDPYINSELVNGKKIPQAVGLSFSVPKEHKKLPPSLKNIFKEIQSCYPDFNYNHGSLLRWVKREKIMLLNAALTVVEKKSGSHLKYWEEWTDKVIEYLAEQNPNIVFILMGGYAKKKYSLLNKNNIIITSVHPSPLSAYRGFFGSEIFKKVNTELKKRNQKEIRWSLVKAV